MTASNYFSFYGIPVSFLVDDTLLKRIFYENSRKYHPDFFTLSSDDEQEASLEASTYNNEAYKVLSDFDKRMRYILELKGMIKAEGDNQLPQDFLMEMMEINESFMELEFDFDPERYGELLLSLEKLEKQQYEEIRPVIDAYKDGETPDLALIPVRDYYFKKKYLLRIRENLSKFAPG